MKRSEHIFLTGFMGAGKTTVGQLLSEKLKVPVFDTDQFIEDQEQMKIKEIFSKKGEAYFRDAETKSLKYLANGTPKIITTGGGIVLREENRKIMHETGIVIFLHCEMEETWRRLANDQTRPLLKTNVADNEALFIKRLPLYNQAHVTVDTTTLTVPEIVDEILRKLE